MTQTNIIEIQNKIEAILFSYGEWINISELSNVLGIDSEMLIKTALTELKSKFENGFSFMIIEEDNKFRMILKKEFENIVEDLVAGVEIPQKVLKVLSVIAYEQPISKTRLSEILGRYVKEEVDYLYKNNFVSYEKKGIGKYYKVTKKFFEYFNMDENDDFRNKANNNINTHFKENEELISDELVKN